MNRWTRILGAAFAVVCAAFFVLPLGEVIYASLSPDVTATPGVGTTQYASFFHDPRWTGALVHSLELAAVVAACNTCLGLVVAVGCSRARSRVVRAVLQTAALTPAVLPVAVFASALFEVSLRIHWYGTALVIAGQTLIALPWAYLFVRAGLARLDPDLTLAALAHGESMSGVVLRIWAPLLRPFLLAAAGLSAAVSLSDPLMPVFLGSSDYQTLAQLTWDSLQHGIDNRTSVGATLILLAATLVALVVGVLIRSSRRAIAPGTRG